MSMADWDFSSEDWILDDEIYVSAPSSIKVGAVDVLSRHAQTQLLRHGRIETYLRYWGAGGNHQQTIFRAFTALGSAQKILCYYTHYTGTVVRLYYYDAGATLVDTQDRLNPVDTGVWYRRRVTWWDTWDILYVRLEFWDGAAWILDCADLIDHDNRLAANLTQRCGLGHAIATPTVNWWDNTLIYGPA